MVLFQFIRKRQLNQATQSNKTIRKYDLREIMIVLSYHVNKVFSIRFYFMIISGDVWRAQYRGSLGISRVGGICKSEIDDFDKFSLFSLLHAFLWKYFN